MIIIGITGSLGSGKGTVAERLKEKWGFRHFSVRDFLTEEIKKRGLPAVRDNMRMVGNDLREKHGSAYIVEELYKQAVAEGGNAIIESVRTLGEVERLRTKNNFYLLAVDADIHTRYERAVLRASETDKVSFEKFKEDETKEMDSSDPSKQNLRGCIKAADKILVNNGTTEEFYTAIDTLTTELLAHFSSSENTNQ